MAIIKMYDANSDNNKLAIDIVIYHASAYQHGLVFLHFSGRNVEKSGCSIHGLRFDSTSYQKEYKEEYKSVSWKVIVFIVAFSLVLLTF